MQVKSAKYSKEELVYMEQHQQKQAINLSDVLARRNLVLCSRT
jgi:hypothetical protein